MANPLSPSKKPHGVLAKQKAEARALGYRAAAYGAGTLVGSFLLASLWFPLGVVGGLAGLGVTAIQTLKWLQFRGKWGLRF